MRTLRAALVVGALFGSAAAAIAQDPAAVAFTDVSVLTMDADTALPGRTVIVRGDSIAWIGPAAEAEIPEGACVVDGAGRFLLPGLADLHVHASATDLPLFLANGVTTIREMNGAPFHLALRDSIAAGLKMGPRMVVSSPLLAGEEQPWRHRIVPDADAATREAHEAHDLGYDALKVYDGLSVEAYEALATASRSLGLPLVGHVPRDVGLEGVLAAGQRSIEHVEQIVYATMGRQPDPAKIPEVVATLAASDAWVVPTLASQRMLAMRRTAGYAERLAAPETRYVAPGLRGWWASLAPEGEGLAPDAPARQRAEAFLAVQEELVAALHAAGVPLLVGTDTPNPLLVPGFSIHDELAALVDAGLPPIDVLRAATADGARFLGQTGKWGVVAPGAAADLLLVDANPLERLDTLRRPVGVLVRGTWLDRDALETMLAEALPPAE